MTRLTKAEQFVYDWQFGRLGDSFMDKLANLIAHADLGNQEKISLGFPDEVAGIQSFQTDAGWWARVHDKGMEGEILSFKASPQTMVAHPVKRKR